MSLGDWGASEGQQRVAAVRPVSLTVPGALNTKSAWTQITAATPFDVSNLLLQLTMATSNGSALFDLGIGPAGAEVVLVANIPGRRISSANHAMQMLLPLSIPAGARIAVRYQQTAATINCTAAAVLMAATWNAAGSCSRVATYGALPASSTGTVVDPGGTANTKGAWVELAGASEFDAVWLMLAATAAGTASTTGVNFLVDVAIGPAGAEQVVVPDLPVYIATVVESSAFRVLLPVSIPAGSRVSVRMQAPTTTTPGREREVVIHLIG